MSLTERRHLGRQQEAVEETGVQLRNDDPIAPVEGQVWINKISNKIKVYRNNEKIVVARGDVGPSVEIPVSGIINLEQSRHWFKDVDADYNIVDFQNIPEGLTGFIKIKNTNLDLAEVTELALPSPTTFANGSYFLINAASNVTEYYVWANFDGLGTDPALPGKTGVEVATSAGLPEITQITCGPASGITSGQYFLINSALNITEYYVWFNKDDNGGDPLLVGKTGIQIPIAGADSAAVIAEKVRDALDSLPAFVGTFLSNVATITNATIGTTTDASNVSVGGMSIATTQQGKGADTPAQFATAMAAAITALSDFNASSLGSVVTVTNAVAGFTDDAVNFNLTGLGINITTQGSGRIFVSLPGNAIVDEDTPLYVDGQKEQIYNIFRSDSLVYFSNGGAYNV
jgi:hypothetical protein